MVLSCNHTYLCDQAAARTSHVKRYPVHTSRSAVPGFSSSRDTPGKQKHNVDWHENRKGRDVAWSATLCVTAYAKTASAIFARSLPEQGSFIHSFTH